MNLQDIYPNPTNHFVSREAAFRVLTQYSRDAINSKLTFGEIRLGRPPVDGPVLLNFEGRYYTK